MKTEKENILDVDYILEEVMHHKKVYFDFLNDRKYEHAKVQLVKMVDKLNRAQAAVIESLKKY